MAKKLLVAQDEGIAELRIRNMPESLRKNLRLLALQEGVTMNDWVIAALIEAVDEKGKQGSPLFKPSRTPK